MNASMHPDESSVRLEEDLSEVHFFYLYLLENTFGEEIPVSGQIAHDTDALRRFVLLLDIAVTPQMIRTGFQAAEHTKAAEALLRFYAQKPHRRREDRDKVDVVATMLFYASFPDFRGNGSLLDDSAVRAFADMLERIYAKIEISEPLPEHLQLVRRFEILRNEASTFRTFNELNDSGIIHRVHGMKQTLSQSFLHPRVLSIIAGYNAYFHGVFDSLFAKATEEMRAFAAQVDRDNAIATPVDERNIVDESAASTNDRLRQLSQVRNTIENDRRQNRNLPSLLSSIKNFQETKTPEAAPEEKPAEKVPRGVPNEPTGYTTPSSAVSTAESETKELEATKAAIRSFVRTSETRGAQVVPLPDGSIQLTDSEAEAFLADYGDEKSFRAEYSALISDMVAIDARLSAQLAAFEKTRHTSYNWMPHADALAHLLSEGKSVSSRAMDLATVARERGLHDKADALHESIEKIRPRGRATVDALQLIGG
jgi:hypothetical protein